MHPQLAPKEPAAIEPQAAGIVQTGRAAPQVLPRGRRQAIGGDVAAKSPRGRVVIGGKMPDIEALLMLSALLMAIGAFAGFLAGLLGVGGGIVLVPAFYYAFSSLGYDGPQLMQVCLGTSLATIVVTSVRAARGHDRRGALDRAILRGWAPAIALGALAGVWVAASLPTQALRAVFAGLALWVGLYLAFGRFDWRLGSSMPVGARRWGLGGLVGGLSVLVGIGGGSFGVPLMTLHGVPAQRAVGTASGFGLVIALPAVLGFLTLDVSNPPPFSIGAVNGVAFALIVAMTLVTAPLGVTVAHRMDGARLRRLFGGFLIVVALNMLRKTLLG